MKAYYFKNLERFFSENKVFFRVILFKVREDFICYMVGFLFYRWFREEKRFV